MAAELRRRVGGEGHAVAVTLGADGAVLVDPDGRAWIGPALASGPYPVGSGDAFLAGLIVGLERGRPWAEAMVLALASAAANAELPGAGKLDPARAEALAAQAEVRPLG
jgi:sugar/nucleoside kinase (ribokinase family)